MVELMLMLFWAVSVSVFALQATTSLTLMLPAVPVVPLLLWMLTLPPLSALDSCAPVSSPPLGAMVKSVGSMVHVPLRPISAAVVTFAEFAI